MPQRWGDYLNQSNVREEVLVFAKNVCRRRQYALGTTLGLEFIHHDVTGSAFCQLLTLMHRAASGKERHRRA